MLRLIGGQIWRLARSLGLALYEYLGIRALWYQARPPNPAEQQSQRPPSTFVLWALGVYVALFGLVWQNYTFRLAANQSRVSTVVAQLTDSSERRAESLSRLSELFRLRSLVEPSLHKPWTVFGALFGRTVPDQEAQATAHLLLQTWRQNLEGITLVDADLSGLELRGARLRNATLVRVTLDRTNLEDADLRWATLTNVTIREANLSRAALIGVDADGLDLAGATATDLCIRWASLAGARFHDTKGWSLQRRNAPEQLVEGANIWGVTDAPAGVLEWAIRNRAVRLEPGSADYYAWRQRPERRE